MLSAVVDDSPQQSQRVVNGGRGQVLGEHVPLYPLNVQLRQFGNALVFQEGQVVRPSRQVNGTALERLPAGAVEVVFFDFRQGAVRLALLGPDVACGLHFALVPCVPDPLGPEFAGKLRGVAFGQPANFFRGFFPVHLEGDIQANVRLAVEAFRC